MVGEGVLFECLENAAVTEILLIIRFPTHFKECDEGFTPCLIQIMCFNVYHSLIMLNRSPFV